MFLCDQASIKMSSIVKLPSPAGKIEMPAALQEESFPSEHRAARVRPEEVSEKGDCIAG